MEAGKDYIGVGVGAVVLDSQGQLFLAQRGPAARNEVGAWEFPGGAVAYGERLEDAIQRELIEEFGMIVEVVGQLAAFDHILPAEHQHWVSITYLAMHSDGRPYVREPEKCSELGWFAADDLPTPLSEITFANVERLKVMPNCRTLFKAS